MGAGGSNTDGVDTGGPAIGASLGGVAVEAITQRQPHYRWRSRAISINGGATAYGGAVGNNTGGNAYTAQTAGDGTGGDGTGGDGTGGIGGGGCHSETQTAGDATLRALSRPRTPAAEPAARQPTRRSPAAATGGRGTGGTATSGNVVGGTPPAARPPTRAPPPAAPARVASASNNTSGTASGNNSNNQSSTNTNTGNGNGSTNSVG